MPLLNIVGITGNNRTPQYCLCFMSGETFDDYKWALQQVCNLLQVNNIPFPRVMITDRELALIEAIDELFPESDHLICRWHVNMNVAKNCKKHFPTQEAWEKFYLAWQAVLNSSTDEAYDKNLAELQAFGSESNATEAVEYLENTWLDLWKEKLGS
jgi:transposase-like protein